MGLKKKLTIATALLCLSCTAVWAGERPAFLQGGDISELSYTEREGAVYRDSQGRAKDCLQILKENGWNFVRLRVYNEPGKGHGDGTYYCPAGFMDKDDMLQLAKRAAAKDMEIQLTFHYSDYWTNGEVQIIPVAWQEKIKGLSEADAITVLEQCVYDYTKEVLQEMKAQGTTSNYISLGNEIQAGMLYPYGRADEKGWPTLARFFNAGAKAVREEMPEAKIILHLDDAGNDKKYEYFFTACDTLGVDYDIIGTSYYPFYGNKSAKDVAEFSQRQGEKFHRPVMIMETGYAFNRVLPNGYPGQIKHNGPYNKMTPNGQKEFMSELLQEMKNVPEPYVLGDLYWDPIMIENPGVGWAYRENDNRADVNVVSNTTVFDYKGVALPVLDAYKENIEGKQGIMISGQVVENDGTPRKYATVTFKRGKEKIKQVTDRYGYYLFSEVLPGEEEAQLTVERIGFNTETIPLGQIGTEDLLDLPTVTLQPVTE